MMTRKAAATTSTSVCRSGISSVRTRMAATSMIQTRLTGISTFQPSRMNWS